MATRPVIRRASNIGSYTAFDIYGTNGLFVAGTNNIDFLVNNAAPSATRACASRSSAATCASRRASPPKILTPPVGQTATVGDTVTFTAAARGTAPLSYQWEKNGVAIPGPDHVVAHPDQRHRRRFRLLLDTGVQFRGLDQ